MVDRALLFTSDIRCLVVGLAALTAGGCAFLAVAVLAVVLPGVSGAWLVLPCGVMLAGLGGVTAWLVFGEGARRFDPAPLRAQQWRWYASER